VAAIADALEKIDSENADIYKKNAEEYTAKLDALDVEYADTVKNAALDTVLFGDRFPFRYMVDDYGLKYYAAFVGCSAETEASFETIAFLAGKVDELGLKNVLTIEGQNHKIAETIIQNTSTKDQGVLTMDSMQSTTTEDVQGGATYLGIMESNLEVLKEALN
jgi:zinc transport system substrate-binding protein